MPDFFKKFASYRELLVKLRNDFLQVISASSRTKYINYGAPQTSDQGPLLLTICINDMPYSPTQSSSAMHSNYTTFAYSRRKLSILPPDLHADVQHLATSHQNTLFFTHQKYDLSLD